MYFSHYCTEHSLEFIFYAYLSCTFYFWQPWYHPQIMSRLAVISLHYCRSTCLQREEGLITCLQIHSGISFNSVLQILGIFMFQQLPWVLKERWLPIFNSLVGFLASLAIPTTEDMRLKLDLSQTSNYCFTAETQVSSFDLLGLQKGKK